MSPAVNSSPVRGTTGMGAGAGAAGAGAGDRAGDGVGATAAGSGSAAGDVAASAATAGASGRGGFAAEATTNSAMRCSNNVGPASLPKRSPAALAEAAVGELVVEPVPR